MPNLCSFSQCCGCSACYAACPKSAISMCPDKEGFLHPSVDRGKCIDCKRCEKACPVLHRSEIRAPLAVYAANAMDDDLRQQSSSGGMFSLLAQQVLDQGGVVYGAAIRKEDLMVHHRSAENAEELSLLRGSKYVQSEMGDTYRRAQSELEKGRQVLFSGTPCQIAGLRTFLGREYDNLLCVDVICHAAPSPLAWRKYLEARAAEIAGRGSAPAEVFDYRRISFRRKNCGWKRYALSLGYASDKAYLGYLGEDSFLRGFLSELYNRPSCHDCSFRDLRSGSDITIADYWNVDRKFPEADDDKGTSLVIVNSAKGRRFFDVASKRCIVWASDYADVVRVNGSVHKSPGVHKHKGRFYFALRFVGFDRLVYMCVVPFASRMRIALGGLARKWGLRK